MIEIKHATIDDLEFIDSVCRTPYIFEACMDGCLVEDAAFKIKNFTMSEVLKNPYEYFLIPVVDGKQIGFFLFTPENRITYDVHTHILKEWRGKTALNSAREAMKWIFKNTNYLKLVCNVPKCFPNVIKFVETVGFHGEGISRKSYMKDNKLIDRLMFGFEKR